MGTCWVNLGDSYSGGVPGQGGNGKSSGLNCKRIADGSFHPDNKSVVRFRGNKINYSVSQKSLCCIPDRFKIAMVDSGWICRNEIIWYKRNCMPSSASDRFTVDFEKIFFFTKQGKYWFEQQFEPPTHPELMDKTRNVHAKKWEKGGFENMDYERRKDTPYCNPQGRNMRCVWDITTKGYKEAHFATFPPELPSRCIKAGCPQGGICLDIFMGSGTTAVVAKKLGGNYIGIELNPAYISMAEKRIADTAVQSQMEL